MMSLSVERLASQPPDPHLHPTFTSRQRNAAHLIVFPQLVAFTNVICLANALFPTTDWPRSAEQTAAYQSAEEASY